MHTYRSQETLAEGATVVPIIVMSDQKNLTNFSGDKKAWPVYITIGNLPSTIRNRPRSMAILLLGLLPIPPNLAKSSWADKLQRLINADTLRGVFELIFAPLNGAVREGAPIDCADGKIRRCFPIISGWIADHMENITLHGIKSNARPKCEVPPEELGSRAGHYPARDYARYKGYERETPSLDSETHNAAHARYTNETHGIKRGQKVFQGLMIVSTPDLHKPDMLHTIYLRLFKHMMDWIQAFLKKTCMTAGRRRCLESFAPLPRILCLPKGLQGGYAVARKRDEKSLALFVGSSRCGVETT